MRQLAIVLACVPALALANPRALPFSYPSAMLPPGALELEQITDLTPVKAFDATGAVNPALRSILTTEIEYGLAEGLELGLYFQFSNTPGASSGDRPLHFDGIKQRLRWRLADPGEWPVDVSLYGEIAEFDNEIELEAKVNLERRFGRFQAIANLWAEREFYFSGRTEWVLHPTGGVAYEISPAVQVGLEYWMQAEFGAAEVFNTAAHHYVAPSLMLQGKRFWCSFAPYVRLDAWNRDARLGDEFGRVWVRMVIGLEP